MGYKVKWIVENLGITRDMLRYYEKEGLMSSKENRDKTNNYRDYEQEDIECIWGIKLLIEIGFTAKEIYSMMHDPNFDFDLALDIKVKQLEKDYKEKELYLEFAKTICLTGEIPESQLGSVKFDQFMSYSLEYWNIYRDEKFSSLAKACDFISASKEQDFSSENFVNVAKQLAVIGEEGVLFVVDGYYQALTDMQDLGSDNYIVQRIVKRIVNSMRDFYNDFLSKNDIDHQINEQLAVDMTIASFQRGQRSAMYKNNYGIDGHAFIAKALEHYSRLLMDSGRGENNEQR